MNQGLKAWVALIGTVGLACQPSEPPQSAATQQARPATAAPTFAGSLDSVPRDSIVAYGRSLVYDTSHAGSDAQHLVARRNGQLVVGPYARIAPEARSHRLSREDMARGRVVARIDADGPYPERGIPAGVSFVWVDSSETGWRSVVVPENASQPMAAKPMIFVQHARAEPVAEEPAQARWSWSPAGGRMTECWDCVIFWCTSQSSEAVRLIR